MSRASVLFLLLFCACRVAADVSMRGTQLRVLPNGLRLLTREQHGAKLIAIDIWVRAGSGEELPGESGAAHFIEHLIFKGTPTRGPGQIDAAIEEMGALLNAGTLRDGAHFYTTVFTPFLEEALTVLADGLRNAEFRVEEVERERAVILDEIASGNADTLRQTRNRLYEALFPGHPYSRSILGEVESLRSITRETIVGFYRRLYAPNNITLALVGDIRTSEAEKLALRLFGDWQGEARRTPQQPPAADATPSEANTPEPRFYESTISSRSAIGIGWRFPSGVTFAESCASDLIAAILLDPLIGRITSHADYERLAKESVGEYETLAAGGMLMLYLACDPQDLNSARGLLNSEAERLWKEGITVAELELAKRRVISRYLFETETYAGQARALGQYDLLGDYRMAMNYIETIRSVTLADVMQCIRRYLQPSRRAEVVLHRKEAGKGHE
jgi:zinc protease